MWLALDLPTVRQRLVYSNPAGLQAVLDRYPGVFQDGLGTLRGFKAKLYVDPDAPPRFHSARSVPYALRDKVDNKLHCLQEEGTLEPVETAKWAESVFDDEG